MVKKVVIIIIFSMLLTSCSSKFDEHLKNGKEALHNENYELAAEEFDAALIEDPSSEEASKLLVRAEEELQKIKEKEEQKERISKLKTYSKNVGDVYFGFFEEFNQIDSEDYDAHLNLIDEVEDNITASPPKELFEQHQLLKDFFSIRKKGVISYKDSDSYYKKELYQEANQLSEDGLQYIEESNSKIDDLNYQVKKYLNEHNIDPAQVGWPFK